MFGHVHCLNDTIAHMFYSIAIAIIASMVYAGWTGGDPFLISIVRVYAPDSGMLVVMMWRLCEIKFKILQLGAILSNI